MSLNKFSQQNTLSNQSTTKDWMSIKCHDLNVSFSAFLNNISGTTLTYASGTFTNLNANNALLFPARLRSDNANGSMYWATEVYGNYYCNTGTVSPNIFVTAPVGGGIKRVKSGSVSSPLQFTADGSSNIQPSITDEARLTLGPQTANFRGQYYKLNLDLGLASTGPTMNAQIGFSINGATPNFSQTSRVTLNSGAVSNVSNSFVVALGPLDTIDPVIYFDPASSNVYIHSMMFTIVSI